MRIIRQLPRERCRASARRGFVLFSLRECGLIVLALAGVLWGIDRVQMNHQLSHQEPVAIQPAVHELVVDDAASELWVVRRAAGISRCRLNDLEVLESSSFGAELASCGISIGSRRRAFACAHADGSVKISADGRQLAEIPTMLPEPGQRSDRPAMVAVTPDGNNIVAVEGNVVHRWSSGARGWQHVVQVLEGRIDRFHLHREGRLLALLIDRTQIRLWDLDQQAWIASWSHPHPFCSSLQWSDDATRLATTGSDADACVWNAKDGSLLWKQRADMMDPSGAAFSPSGKYLVTGGFEGLVRLWDASNGALVWERTGHQRTPRVFAWTIDSRRVFSSGLDGQVHMWNVPE